MAGSVNTRSRAVFGKQSWYSSALAAAMGPNGPNAAASHSKPRLEVIQPAVDSDNFVIIARFHAVDAAADAVELPVHAVGSQHSAVAEAAEVFGRIETEAGHVAERARERFR